LGLLVGQALGLAVPDAFVSDRVLATISGSIASALATLGILRRYTPSPLAELERELRKIDEMKKADAITDLERKKLRVAAIERHTLSR
jgi:hypothetical protein